MKIYKYQGKAPLNEPIVLDMPLGRIIHAVAEPLTSGRQSITLWVRVADRPIVTQRTFITVGTGAQIANGLVHVLTYPDGVFWWHLFEVEPGVSAASP